MDASLLLERRRTIDGASLHYTEAGAGDVVLFLHGMPTSAYLWRRVQPLLAPECRAVAVDLLGFGRSDKPETRDLSLEAQASLVATFALSLDAGPVTLVGHDWGGAVAQVVASRTPGVVSRLVLLAAHTDGTWPSLEMERFLPRMSPSKMTVDDLLGHVREAIPGQAGRREAITPEAMEAYLAPWSTPAGMGAFLNLARKPAANVLRAAADDLARSWIPMLLLWGEIDRVIPLEEGRRLAGRLPSATLEVVPQAGHLLPEEAPEEVARRVGAFHRRTASPR